MQQRSRDAVIVEIRSAQKKLAAAKKKRNREAIKYLQAHIKQLQDEMAACDQVA